jgi:hypothetical protein
MDIHGMEIRKSTSMMGDASAGYKPCVDFHDMNVSMLWVGKCTNVTLALQATNLSSQPSLSCLLVILSRLHYLSCYNMLTFQPFQTFLSKNLLNTFYKSRAPKRPFLHSYHSTIRPSSPLATRRMWRINEQADQRLVHVGTLCSEHLYNILA